MHLMLHIIIFLFFKTINHAFFYFRLYFELPATGGVVANSYFRTVNLLMVNLLNKWARVSWFSLLWDYVILAKNEHFYSKFVNSFDYFIMGTIMLFFCFVVYYIIEEFLEIVTKKWGYLFDFWNLMDLVVVGVIL